MEQINTKLRYFNTIRDEFQDNEVLFDLPVRVYCWYKNNVKDNGNISYEEARKKLSRNVYLARESNLRKDDGRQYFFYGNMTICLNKKGDGYELGYINNNKGYFTFYMDYEYRSYLNDRFEIIENGDRMITYNGMVISEYEYINFC